MSGDELTRRRLLEAAAALPLVVAGADLLEDVALAAVVPLAPTRGRR